MTNPPISKHVRMLSLGLPLALSLICAVVWSMHWPLVGDASLMHYVVFLMSRGLRPYRDIFDINLPGTYLAEFLAIKFIGASALAWRLYDLLLLALCAAAMTAIAKTQRWISGATAAAIFALIHMQDGIAQLGQRDLLVTLLLLAAYAVLFAAQRGVERLRTFVFIVFLLIGLSFTIKPTFFLLGMLLMGLSAKRMHALGLSYVHYFGCCVSGMLTPSLLAVMWLIHNGCLLAFIERSIGLILFHAELGRKSLSFLCAHATSPIQAVFISWLIILALTRPRLTLERVELIAGVLMAFGAYVSQGKGYPYHRYPLLGLLLISMELDFVEAWGHRAIPQLVAGFALIFQCVYLAPQAALLARSFSTATPFQDGLTGELNKLGPELPGQVQCLDTFGGCVNTLLNLRIVQSSGYLYDCYLFVPQQTSVSMRYRDDFWRAYSTAKPRIVVMTDQFCFGEKSGFAKLNNWPLLQQDLARNYVQKVDWQTQAHQHWWSRQEATPRFRIFVRK